MFVRCLSRKGLYRDRNLIKSTYKDSDTILHINTRSTPQVVDSQIDFSNVALLIRCYDFGMSTRIDTSRESLRIDSRKLELFWEYERGC